MIKEFAIEPEVMATWSHFHSLWDDFGVGKGRLISKYPVMWMQKVVEVAKTLSPPVRATAIASRIYAEQHKFVVKSRNYDGTRPWLENAESQMALDPFHAIIARQNPSGTAAVLVAGEFDKTVAPYRVETQRTIPRTAIALSACARLLVSTCDELQIVDPHFDPAEPRFSDTFKAILAMHDSAPHRLKVLELHCEKQPAFNRGNRQHHLRCAFESVIPAGTMLRAYFWSRRPGGENLHPRFLLTELGGLQFDYGFDTGHAGETTVVTLMDHALWQTARAKYSRPSPCFDITPDCIIEIPGQA